MDDVLIIGGGPAGAAAAINARAEGLTVTLLAEQCAGRCHTSHAIENILGHLSITGQELAAVALSQLEKFGVTVVIGRAHKLGLRMVQTDAGLTLEAQDIVLAAGMQHRQLDIPGMDLLNVFYHTAPQQIGRWQDKRVLVVGGENSASQAALHLAQSGAEVHMLLQQLPLKMSAYLVPMLKAHPNVAFTFGTLQAFEGSEDKTVTAACLQGGGHLPVDAVFVYNGAIPNTAWLRGRVDLDDRGFIKTAPENFQTSLSRVWAVGDIRSGSVKRIATAIGEGTSVVWHILRRRG